MDLDWLYGRSEKAVDKIRLRDGHGRLNLTDDDLPHKLEDGTWLVCLWKGAHVVYALAVGPLTMRPYSLERTKRDEGTGRGGVCSMQYAAVSSI